MTPFNFKLTTTAAKRLAESLGDADLAITKIGFGAGTGLVAVNSDDLSTETSLQDQKTETGFSTVAKVDGFVWSVGAVIFDGAEFPISEIGLWFDDGTLAAIYRSQQPFFIKRNGIDLAFESSIRFANADSFEFIVSEVDWHLLDSERMASIGAYFNQLTLEQNRQHEKLADLNIWRVDTDQQLDAANTEIAANSAAIRRHGVDIDSLDRRNLELEQWLALNALTLNRHEEKLHDRK